jgi:hypothetical protein
MMVVGVSLKAEKVSPLILYPLQYLRYKRGVRTSFLGPNKTASEEATTSDPQPLTKKQRQNAQRREALKEVKREREAQQQAALASHKRELEHARVAEKSTTSKRTGSRFDSLG